MKHSLGNLVREKRLDAGYESQRELAIKMKVSNATIARMEKDEALPLPATLKQLSLCLNNVTYKELMAAAGYLEIEGLKEGDAL